jgi:large subunit ribosomal protein L25
MNKKVIQLEARFGNAMKMREANKIPVVLYGFNIKNAISLCVDVDIKNTFNKLGKFVYSTLFEVHIGEDKYTCIVKGIEKNPVTEEVIHLDFQSLGGDGKFMLYCPINVVNKEKCEALKSKAAMFIPKPFVKVRCSLSNFVPSVDINIADFPKGKKVHTTDIDNIEFDQKGLLFAIR